MNVTWGSIRSWHALPPTRALVATKALCGRNVPEGERHETRPAGRSCETCLRRLSRASGE